MYPTEKFYVLPRDNTDRPIALAGQLNGQLATFDGLS